MDVIDDPDTPPSKNWRIDRTIPVSLIVVILIQTFGLFAWAMGLQSRVTFLESTSVTRESFARLDEKMNGMKDDMAGLKKDMAENTAEVRRFYRQRSAVIDLETKENDAKFDNMPQMHRSEIGKLRDDMNSRFMNLDRKADKK